jgi:acetoin utilization protein AcuB
MSPTERLQRRAVDRVMRRHWISLSPLAAVDQALQLMRMARVRQLPVVSDGILVGVVSYPGVVAARLAGMAALVGQVMVRAGETAEPATTLGVVAALMQRAPVGCVLVVEPTGSGPPLLGIVTEADLLRLAYGAASVGAWA